MSKTYLLTPCCNETVDSRGREEFECPKCGQALEVEIRELNYDGILKNVRAKDTILKVKDDD